MKKVDDNRSNIIKIKNNLVEGFVKRNNLISLKILFFISYRIDDKFDNLKENDMIKFTISGDEVCKYCKVDMKSIKRNIKAMQSTSIHFENDKSEIYVSLIPRCKIDYNNNIYISIFKDVYDLILNVKKEYTQINAEQLMLLNSKNSVRMLMILNMINGFDDHVPKLKKYSLESLNKMFGTNFPRMGEFDRTILKKVKIDLDINVNLSFEYDIIYDKDSISAGRPRAIGATIKLIKNKPQPTLF